MKILKFISAIFVALLVCPDNYCDGAVQIEPSRYSFNDLLDAIATVESNNDPNAVGDKGEAIGVYQIHKIYVDDVNRILRYPAFSYADRQDARKSRSMASVYLRHYGKNKSIAAMARIHNGGPKGHKKKSTLQYWQKVRKVLGK